MKTRYLDPKNDLTFKRIFGEHPHLLISFLNALMPLPPNRLIERLEYLSPEQVPEHPLGKNSIVDVKCTDNQGRRFIVEMQMYWSEVFKSRMVFNASKAYVRQIGKRESYRLLQPVYGLGILNDTFDNKTEEFYHHYQTINRYNTEEVIEGLEFIMVELPKFKPAKWSDRKMAVLWLRFLSEVEDETQNVSADLLENKEIQEALSLCEEGAFTPKELERYDQYWDYIRREKGIADQARIEGLMEGRMKGEAIGEAKGRTQGKAEELQRIVLTAHQNKLSIEQIQAFSGLSKDGILEILKRNKNT
ncbi:MAG: Rpn family recombination-promoting nuclease/putative transposase [Dysgonamonadaceae bacterium]|jgi:predicted transposase/invertase (TIGR01784 family)|nr:Rpn family recombination-promoting nuclease/putative transposase [Dysgonamonadaceae bacterium]